MILDKQNEHKHAIPQVTILIYDNVSKFILNKGEHVHPQYVLNMVAGCSINNTLYLLSKILGIRRKHIFLASLSRAHFQSVFPTVFIYSIYNTYYLLFGQQFDENTIFVGFVTLYDFVIINNYL